MHVRTLCGWLMIGLLAAGCQGRLEVDSVAPGASGEQVEAPGPQGNNTSSPFEPDPEEPEPTTPEAPEAGDTLAVRGLPTLTEADYHHTVRDVLGVDARHIALPSDETIGGSSEFLSNHRRQFGTSDLARFFDASAEVARRVDIDAVFGCQPDSVAQEEACVRAFLTERGERLWRRAISAPKQDELVALATADRDILSWTERARLLVQSMLQSPFFIYHLEFGHGDPNASGLVPLAPSEMASRLAYFLWNAPPDAELLQAADAGDLDTREGVEAQAQRMLDDPRAIDSIEQFHAQWLLTGRLDGELGRKSPERFPLWRDPETVQMLREALGHYAAQIILTEDGDLADLLTSDRLAVNGPLAELFRVEYPEETFDPMAYPERDRAPRAVSLNFRGAEWKAERQGIDNVYQLNPEDAAGVATPDEGARAHWNNLGGGDGSAAGLTDHTGRATGATAQWVGPETGHVDEAFDQIQSASERMMHGFIKAWRSTAFVTINDLDADFVDGGYDVYVYFAYATGRKDTADRVVTFEVNGQVKKLFHKGGSTFQNMGEQFVEAQGETPANMVVFRDLRAADINLSAYVSTDDIDGYISKNDACPKVSCGSNTCERLVDRSNPNKQNCYGPHPYGNTGGTCYKGHRGHCKTPWGAVLNRLEREHQRIGIAGVQVVARQSYAASQHARQTFEMVEGEGRFPGLLAQPAFTAAHAHVDTSGPIFRGVTVRHQMLCQELPPPPDDIEIPEVDESLPKRQYITELTGAQDCQGCHTAINPIGFGFEQYDAIGRWQEQDKSHPVDASGALPPHGVAYFDSPLLSQKDAQDVEGEFVGLGGLNALLAESRTVRRCMALQWYRYAMRAKETPEDRAAFEEVWARWAAAGYHMRELIVAITGSIPFRYIAVPTDAE